MLRSVGSITLPSTRTSTNWSLVFQPTFCMHFSSSPHVLHFLSIVIVLLLAKVWHVCKRMVCLRWIKSSMDPLENINSVSDGDVWIWFALIYTETSYYFLWLFPSLSLAGSLHKSRETRVTSNCCLLQVADNKMLLFWKNWCLHWNV